MVLRHNDKIVYETPATDRLIDRLEMFTVRPFEQLISIDHQLGRMRLWGYVGHPAVNKANTEMAASFLERTLVPGSMIQMLCPKLIAV